MSDAEDLRASLPNFRNASTISTASTTGNINMDDAGNTGDTSNTSARSNTCAVSNVDVKGQQLICDTRMVAEKLVDYLDLDTPGLCRKSATALVAALQMADPNSPTTLLPGGLWSEMVNCVCKRMKKEPHQNSGATLYRLQTISVPMSIESYLT